MSPRTKIIALFSAFAAGALILVTAVTLFLPEPPPKVTGQAAVGGPFSLTDQNGRPITEAALKGKPTLIFFGFTHCPDVCPTALFEMSEIFNALGPDAGKAQAFFVSVDPERDTPDVLKSYVSSFSPQIVGLSGTPEATEQIPQGPAEGRRLHHGPHRRGLSHGQGRQFRRPIQLQAASGRGRGRAEALLLSPPTAPRRAAPCSVFCQW